MEDPGWVVQALGQLIPLAGAVWTLLARQQSAMAKIEDHLAVIEERLSTMTMTVSEAREARKNLWEEIRTPDQRITRLEAHQDAGS